MKFTRLPDLKSSLEPLEVLPQVLPQVAEEATKWLLHTGHRRLERAFITTTLKDVPFTEALGNTFTTETPLILQRTLDRFLFRLDIGTPFFDSPEAKTWVSQRACLADGTPCRLPELISDKNVAGLEGLDLYYTPFAFTPPEGEPVAVVMPGAGMRIEGTLEDARGREFVSQLHGLGIEHFILVNLLGFSNNAGNANQFSLHQVGVALEELLREEGIAPQCVLFGYSTSNYVANTMLAMNHAYAQAHPRQAPFHRLKACFEFSAFTSLPKTVIHHVFKAPNPSYTPMEQWVIGRFLPLLEQSGAFNNIPLLERIHPDTDVHFLVSASDHVTPLGMSERLHRSAREDGIQRSSLTVLPPAPDHIDGHAEGVLEGVLHGQKTLSAVLERLYPPFKANTLRLKEGDRFKGAKSYGDAKM
jgi:hypothetical protein